MVSSVPKAEMGIGSFAQLQTTSPIQLKTALQGGPLIKGHCVKLTKKFDGVEVIAATALVG